MTRWIVMFNTAKNDKQTRCILETALNKAEATNRHVEAWNTEDVELLQKEIAKLRHT